MVRQKCSGIRRSYLDTSASVLIPEAARVWMRQDERATKADEITRDGFQEFGDLKIKKI